MLYSSLNIKPSIVELFNNFLNFVNIDFINIDSFYKQKIKVYPQISFNNLDNLLDISNNILIYLSKNKEIFDNINWFDYLEQLEQINNYLTMVKNSPRWLRLTKSDNKYQTSIQQTNLLEDNSTIENNQKNNPYYKNIDTDVSTIEYDNRLTELNYKNKDATIFTTNVLTNFSAFSNDSVVDVMYSDSIYGKDIDVNFSFYDNDIKCLNTTDTLYQASAILLNLTKGDNPEFKNDGIQKNLLVGSTKAFITLPILTRQWQENFLDDTTITSATINDIDSSGDILNISFSIQPIVGEIFQLNTTA